MFAGSVFGQTKYETYTNARFGYSIQYPVGVLKPQKEADNGDGRVFVSADKTAELHVWGMYNALSDTLKKAYLSDLKERSVDITYKLLSSDSYVISRTVGSKIFYQKTILNGTDGDTRAIFSTFRIEYRKADKAKYDPIVKRIAKSFKFN